MSDPQKTPPEKAPLHPHAVKTSVIGFGVLFLLVLLNWAAIHFGWVRVPPNTLPWIAPKLDVKPGLFVHLQMQELRRDRQVCLTALNSASGLSYAPLPDMTEQGDCGYTNVVRVTRAPIAFNTAPVTTCSLSAALYWWERDLQTIAALELHTSIKRIDQIGTYECRNIDHATFGKRSEHATANAIDIAGFDTADGRHITVAQDWNKPTQEGAFLHAAHDSACVVFGEVLGPQYDRFHANHFHFDEANWLICR